MKGSILAMFGSRSPTYIPQPIAARCRRILGALIDVNPEGREPEGGLRACGCGRCRGDRPGVLHLVRWRCEPHAGNQPQPQHSGIGHGRRRRRRAGGRTVLADGGAAIPNSPPTPPDGSGQTFCPGPGDFHVCRLVGAIKGVQLRLKSSVKSQTCGDRAVNQQRENAQTLMCSTYGGTADQTQIERRCEPCSGQGWRLFLDNDQGQQISKPCASGLATLLLPIAIESSRIRKLRRGPFFSPR